MVGSMSELAAERGKRSTQYNYPHKGFGQFFEQILSPGVCWCVCVCLCVCVFVCVCVCMCVCVCAFLPVTAVYFLLSLRTNQSTLYHLQLRYGVIKRERELISTQ